MNITLNGEDRELPGDEELTVADLIGRLELGPQPVLIELDGEALHQREFTEKIVGEGSVVEIVRMVAGG